MSGALHAPALYGKIPAQGDFVRSNLVDPAALEFSRWLEEAQETMHRTGATLGDLPVCFLHSLPQARTAVIGALLPSRDAVGRLFPIAAFVPVETAPLSRSYPRAPLAYALFLGEVALLAREAAGLTGAAVLERVRRLPLPGAAELALADELSERLLEQPARGLLDSVSADGIGPAYGFKTFLSACAADAAEPPTRTRVVLECPLAGEGPAPWLELARRILLWRQPPAFFWTEAAPPRLLLSLGAPPASLLNHLARPDPRSSLVWPLRTTQRGAADAALRGLTSSQRAALEDPTGSISRLFSSLTGTGNT